MYTKGFLPSLPELVKTLRKAVVKVKGIRSKAVDLTHILDVLATGALSLSLSLSLSSRIYSHLTLSPSAPQRLTGVAPVVLRPILESGENPQGKLDSPISFSPAFSLLPFSFFPSSLPPSLSQKPKNAFGSLWI